MKKLGWFLTLKIDFESQILALFDTNPLHQFSKFNNFLWVCWFLGRNISNFVYLLQNFITRITILTIVCSGAYLKLNWRNCLQKWTPLLHTISKDNFINHDNMLIIYTSDWVFELGNYQKLFLKIEQAKFITCQHWQFEVVV